MTVVDGLTLAEAAETHHYLLGCPVYPDAHVPQTARNAGVTEPVYGAWGDSECLCVPTRNAILAPHLLERALAYTDLAAAYLGRDPPVLYSMNAFWTRPGTAPIRLGIQEFHVDEDDTKFLAMFFYLTDIKEWADGPHEIQGYDGQTHTVYGPAGTAFLADTSQPHRGLKPLRGERCLAWARWGVSDRPPANVWDGIEPIEAAELGSCYPIDPRLRESIRLLVR